jgi:glucose 1-dehydrogenase
MAQQDRLLHGQHGSVPPLRMASSLEGFRNQVQWRMAHNTPLPADPQHNVNAALGGPAPTDPVAPEASPPPPHPPIPHVLEGQPALVTGANSGIGRAIALALGRAGADVVVNYVSGRDAAEAVAAEVRSFGPRAIAVQADVGQESAVEGMFAEAVKAFGTLHVVVCNAGLQRDAPFHAMTLEQWNTVIGVNLTGQFLCARSAVREFVRRGVDARVSAAAGKLIHMSSVHEMIPWAGHANYAASKGGVMILMKSLAQEVAPMRIRVNAIAPGAIRTPINTDAWKTPEAYAELMTLVPYKRIGEPEDIARAAVWLASDASDYVTGTSLFVDGGMSLFPGFASGG